MTLSRAARLMTGITLLSVPTIAYGGLALLGRVTHGAAGLSGMPELTATQHALYRAGHAHAGVLLLLSLVVQLLLDAAHLPTRLAWTARLAAPSAALLLSGGFFGLAHLPALRGLLYAGGLCLVVAVVLTGVGLVRRGAPPLHQAAPLRK